MMYSIIYNQRQIMQDFHCPSAQLIESTSSVIKHNGNTQPVSTHSKLPIKVAHQQLMGTNFGCTICSNIVDRPVVCKKCNSLMCQVCLENWKQFAEFCPNESCDQTKQIETRGVTPKDIGPLLELIVDCVNCPERFAYKNATKHQPMCSQQGNLVECPWGCKIQIQPSLIKEHLSTTCPMALLQCKKCSLVLRRSLCGSHSCVKKLVEQSRSFEQENSKLKQKLAQANIRADKYKDTLKQVQQELKDVPGSKDLKDMGKADQAFFIAYTCAEKAIKTLGDALSNNEGDRVQNQRKARLPRDNKEESEEEQKVQPQEQEPSDKDLTPRATKMNPQNKETGQGKKKECLYHTRPQGCTNKNCTFWPCSKLNKEENKHETSSDEGGQYVSRGQRGRGGHDKAYGRGKRNDQNETQGQRGGRGQPRGGFGRGAKRDNSGDSKASNDVPNRGRGRASGRGQRGRGDRTDAFEIPQYDAFE